jgi:hypothetical protein
MHEKEPSLFNKLNKSLEKYKILFIEKNMNAYFNDNFCLTLVEAP